MYPWIWRHLPGPLAVKSLLAALLVLAVVAACFVWVFPAAEPFVPFNDNTVDDNSTVEDSAP